MVALEVGTILPVTRDQRCVRHFDKVFLGFPDRTGRVTPRSPRVVKVGKAVASDPATAIHVRLDVAMREFSERSIDGRSPV